MEHTYIFYPAGPDYRHRYQTFAWFLDGNRDANRTMPAWTQAVASNA